MSQRREVPKSPPEGDAKLATSGQIQVSDGDQLYVAEGEVIGGKYRVDRILGMGGVGFVVAAVHTELGGHFALKFLKKGFLQDKNIVERFTREARAACRIKSEYVARVYDVGMHGRAPYLVMEHLSGRDLAAILAERGPLPIGDAIEYSVQACAALATAHASGIVHRDIKPENLFVVDEEGTPTVKLLDFGISKVALAPELAGDEWGPEGEPITGTMTCGTPLYMSPEQVRSTATVDARSDVWSLGTVLFELLAGTTAFHADNVVELCKAIVEQEPLWLTDLRPDVPLLLADVVSRCLQKDVSRRYQNVAELAVALLPFAPPRALAIAEGSSWIRRAAIQALGANQANEGRLSGNDILGDIASGPVRSGPPSGHMSGHMRTSAPGAGANRAPTPSSTPTQTSVRVTGPEVAPSAKPKRTLAIVAGAALVLASIAAWAAVQSHGSRKADDAKPTAEAPAFTTPPATAHATATGDPSAAMAQPSAATPSSATQVAPSSSPAAAVHAAPQHYQYHPAPVHTPQPSAHPPAPSAAAPAEPAAPAPVPGPPVAPGRPDLGY